MHACAPDGLHERRLGPRRSGVERSNRLQCVAAAAGRPKGAMGPRGLPPVSVRVRLCECLLVRADGAMFGANKCAQP